MGNTLTEMAVETLAAMEAQAPAASMATRKEANSTAQRTTTATDETHHRSVVLKKKKIRSQDPKKKKMVMCVISNRVRGIDLIFRHRILKI